MDKYFVVWSENGIENSREFDTLEKAEGYIEGLLESGFNEFDIEVEVVSE